MMLFLRSAVFNAVYLTTTLIIGVIILPTLLLPDRLYWPVVRGYFLYVHLLEKYLLGLTYVVRGAERVPAGAFIVAAKHQSAFETLRLPLLFDRPVVILKRELLMIPFWGWYAWKAGMIGINRQNARTAIEQMRTGSAAALAAGRIVVIFPQGTRVSTTDTPADKPYKRGIADLYAHNHVPVVPMAVNTGLYYPRNSFLKRPGTAILEFLPSLAPGKSADLFMADLTQALEATSTELAATPEPHTPSLIIPNVLTILCVLATLYTGAWFYGASVFRDQAKTIWLTAAENGTALSLPLPRLSGFPGPYQLHWAGSINTPDLTTHIPDLRVTFWPVPLTDMRIDLPKGLRLSGPALETPLIFDRLRATFQIPQDLPETWTQQAVQKLHDEKTTFILRDLNGAGPHLGDLVPVFTAAGHLSYDANLQPQGEMRVTLNDPDGVLAFFAPGLRPLEVSMAQGLIGSMAITDEAGQKILPLTFTLRDQALSAGPIRITHLPVQYWPDADQGASEPVPGPRRVRAPVP